MRLLILGTALFATGVILMHCVAMYWGLMTTMLMIDGTVLVVVGCGILLQYAIDRA